MVISRRSMVRDLAAGVGAICCTGGAFAEEAQTLSGWTSERFEGRKVFARGTGAKTVVLLHELPGMSPGCIDFGSELAGNGFKVSMPLLFGHPGQESVALGTIQSCFFGGFHCFSPAGKADTGPVQWLQRYVSSLGDVSGVTSIAVIGMCETGAYPLATMEKGGKVKAVVLSQPALPLGKKWQSSVGITDGTLEKARESRVPMMGLRFKQDTISTHARFEYLSGYFKDQFEGHELDGPLGFHQTCTHRLHAVLTGQFDGARDQARKMVIGYLSAKLR